MTGHVQRISWHGIGLARHGEEHWGFKGWGDEAIMGHFAVAFIVDKTVFNEITSSKAKNLQ